MYAKKCSIVTEQRNTFYLYTWNLELSAWMSRMNLMYEECSLTRENSTASFGFRTVLLVLLVKFKYISIWNQLILIKIVIVKTIYSVDIRGISNRKSFQGFEKLWRICFVSAFQKYQVIKKHDFCQIHCWILISSKFLRNWKFFWCVDLLTKKKMDVWVFCTRCMSSTGPAKC